MKLRHSLLTRYFLICFSVLLVFGLSGAFSSFLVLRIFGEQMGDRPPHFIANFVNAFVAEGLKPARVVSLLNQSNAGLLPLDYYYFDGAGQMQAAPKPALLTAAGVGPLLPSVDTQQRKLDYVPAQGDQVMAVRLNTGGYLVMHLVQERNFLSKTAYVPALIAFVFFLLLGFSLAFGYVVLRLRERFEVAKGVLADLKAGHLQARFPITRMDEFGYGMTLFNDMAEEIERHVQKLRHREAQTRTFFIGVAHDLRTPVAAQRSLLEILHEQGEALPAAQRAHFVHLSLLETHYFGRLVEDMLFLSKLDLLPERSSRVNLAQLVQQCCEQLGPESRSCLSLDLDDSAHVLGDALLLTRLLRNLLDNASTYAEQQIYVSVRQTERHCLLRVEDDGPGLSELERKEYGTQRHSRRVQGDKISLGLGSVIVAEITRLHGGELRVANQGERLSGAVVEIKLPTA
ncbi:MAG: sensor histidine kinase [Candidatus Sericytochromatia bacterium]